MPLEIMNAAHLLNALHNVNHIPEPLQFWQAKYSTNGCLIMSQLVDYNSFDKKLIDRKNILSYKFRYIECDTERNPAWAT